VATNTTAARRTAPSPTTARAGTILQRLRGTWQRWQEHARIHGELTQMSTRELADLGLSQADIPDVVRGTYRRC